MNGHFVSGFLKTQFPAHLSTKFKELENDTRETLFDIFENISNKLIANTHIDITFSGSTVVSVLMRNHKIYCANLGDSRAVIGKKVEDNWASVALSRDHKPNEKDEADRINRCGGRVETFRDMEGKSIGPLRVWMRSENVPGLAMTRSMGDAVAASVGVSQEPEILE